MTTNDVSDTRISAERLAELRDTVERRRKTTFVQGEWRFLCDLHEALTELLASRTQEPAEWQVEAVAKIVYELNPFHEGGEYVDGFLVSPGGDLSWDQACQRDQECAGVFLPVTKEARDTALKILRAASITPPAPERSKEETVGLKAFADAILDLAKDGMTENDLSFNSGLCAALEAIRPLIDAALETPPLHKEGEAWVKGIESAPCAATVLATYWSEEHAEWIVQLFVAERPTAPFTHWQYVTRPGEAAPAPVPVTITDELRRAFRNANESDWQHLFAVLPDTHRGRFWKAVMTEARAALSAKPGEQG